MSTLILKAPNQNTLKLNSVKQNKLVFVNYNAIINALNATITGLEYDADQCAQILDDIKNAIENKGVTMHEDVTISDYAKLISRITTSDVNLYEQLQQSGNRKDYSYAFCNWSGEIISPTFDFNEISSIVYMFMGASEVIDLSNITLNMKSSNISLMYSFVNCLALEHPPKFTYQSTTDTSLVVRTLTSAFANCVKLIDCEVYFGDGTQDPIAIRNAMQNTFMRCTSLKKITFTGKGSPFKLDLSWCRLIEIDTINSLKNALMDVSGATSGDYTIKINDSTYALLSDSDIAEFETLGWTITHEDNGISETSKFLVGGNKFKTDDGDYYCIGGTSNG